MISVKHIIANTRFSHRPQLGVSVGVYIDPDTNIVWMAASFVNTMDQFNRRLARQIIGQRIQSAIAGNNKVRYVINHPGVVGMSATGIMHHFRNFFKPDLEEADTTYTIGSEFGGVETRRVISRAQTWIVLQKQFDDAVTAAEGERCGS